MTAPRPQQSIADEMRDLSIHNCVMETGDVRMRIKQQANKGETSILEKNLKTGTVAWLEDAGFTVDIIRKVTDNQTGETFTTHEITW